MLLERPAPERRQYFWDYTIAHPHLVQVYQQLREEVTTVDPGSLIFACGPSGIGKTTLLRRVESKILEEVRQELEQDPCRLPLVMVEALSPETGNFNWKDFYWRLLDRLGEPCIDKKIIPDLQRNDHHDHRHIALHAKPGIADLRHAVEQALRYRRPVAVCIDLC